MFELLDSDLAGPWEHVIFGVIGGAWFAHKLVELEDWSERQLEQRLKQKMIENQVSMVTCKPARIMEGVPNHAINTACFLFLREGSTISIAHCWVTNIQSTSLILSRQLGSSSRKCSHIMSCPKVRMSALLLLSTRATAHGKTPNINVSTELIFCAWVICGVLSKGGTKQGLS